MSAERVDLLVGRLLSLYRDGRWVEERVGDVDESQSSETVEAVTVDEIISQQALVRVDWIKVDIEGGEIEALRGAENTLARFQPKLFVEVHQTAESLRGFLNSHGYRIEQELFDQPPAHHGWILARPL